LAFEEGALKPPAITEVPLDHAVGANESVNRGPRDRRRRTERNYSMRLDLEDRVLPNELRWRTKMFVSKALALELGLTSRFVR
jgi:hypothetical protein